MSEEEIKHEWKIDGVDCIARSLDFLAVPQPNLPIQYPFLLKKRKSNYFKGVNMAQSERHLLTNRFSFAWGSELLVVFKLRVDYVPYDLVIQMLNSALEETLLNEMGNTKTGISYKSSKQAVKRTTSTIHVMMEDVHQFGLQFMQKLKSMVNTSPWVEDCFYILHGMGQSYNCDGMREILRFIINPRHLLEYVLHMALDYTMEGHALLWKYKTIKVRHSDMTLTGQYYPMCWKGSGNFYFTNKEKQKRGDPCVKLEKLYSTPGSEFHKGTEGGGPFRVSKMAPALLSSQLLVCSESESARKQLDSLLVDAVQLRNGVNVLLRQNCCRSRVEFVISCVEPDKLCHSRMVTLAKTEVQNRCLLDADNFIIIKYQDLTNHLRKHLMPCIRTVLKELRKRLQRWGDQQQNHELYTLLPHQFLTISAAEAIISFFIYGVSCTITHRGSTSFGHNNDLCRLLGLVPSYFREENFTEDMKLFNGKIVRNAHGTISYIDSSTSIYTAQQMLNGNVTDHDVGFLTIMNLIGCEYDIDNWKEASKLVLIYICKVALKRSHVHVSSYEFEFNLYRLVKLGKTVRAAGNTALLTSFQFIERLLNFSHPTHQTPGIKVLNEHLKNHFKEKRDLYNKFLKRLSILLENALWRNCCNFVFPIGLNSFSFVAVPIALFDRRLGWAGSRPNQDPYYKLMGTTYNMYVANSKESIRFKMGIIVVLGHLKTFDLNHLSNLDVAKVLKWADVYAVKHKNARPVSSLIKK